MNKKAFIFFFLSKTATFLGQKKQQKDWLLVLNGSKISSLGLKCVFLYLKTTVDWIVPGILINIKLVLFLIYSQCMVLKIKNVILFLKFFESTLRKNCSSDWSFSQEQFVIHNFFKLVAGYLSDIIHFWTGVNHWYFPFGNYRNSSRILVADGLRIKWLHF